MFGDYFGESIHTIYVKIGDLQNAVSIEGSRETRTFQTQRTNDGPERVSSASRIQTGGFQTQLQKRFDEKPLGAVQQRMAAAGNASARSVFLKGNSGLEPFGEGTVFSEF